MEEKMFLIPEGLLQGVVDYMMTRPYKEVCNAVPALMNLKPQEAPCTTLP